MIFFKYRGEHNFPIDNKYPEYQHNSQEVVFHEISRFDSQN